ncbi:MAG: 2-oxoglutarate dehydrogenase E1 component [Simkaniaceae bacterium]|nr:2-oxoglutarate dehydrogenase E1 component [Simkaniaceae bacterium]
MVHGGGCLGPFGYANLANASFIEKLYKQYLEDPKSVDLSWQRFFEGVQFGSVISEGPHEALEGADLRVYFLILAYREHGHLLAQFNKIYPHEREGLDALKLERFGLGEGDLAASFPTYGILSEASAPLSKILEQLKLIYCGGVGYEFSHIKSEEVKAAIVSGIEPSFGELTKEEKIALYEGLVQAEFFEKHIHKAYQGQKRFSLEGGETAVPMLLEMVEHGAQIGVDEIQIGMAHRGRLSVLANVMGKPYEDVFYEFEGHYVPVAGEGSGDVKYHKGYISQRQTREGKSVKLGLEANPSHLESVDPIVEGCVRAKQDFEYDEASKIVPLLIHGDASLAGQGVVYETMQLRKLEGYKTGGTLHLVINNQIGFTANPEESRSTTYCTDIALSFESPVFHVDGEDPISCVQAMRLALEIRQKFAIDVFIDLNCYRKYGHNETDEPGYTQPLTYAGLKGCKTTRENYRDKLISEGVLNQDDAKRIEDEFFGKLQAAKSEEKRGDQAAAEAEKAPAETRGERGRICELAKRLGAVPDGFSVHPKIRKMLDERVAAVESSEAKIDWGTAEQLAYALLVTEGHGVRLSGQDSQRGTFSHRHAALTDQKTNERYIPLANIEESQAPFYAYNSSLSEYAVLGFEFGYAMYAPKALVIWEAQFGDFANGAQIIIDQYVSGSEQKWGKHSGLVMLLPHGYEGMGPEHSSARLERFLQLSAQENMRVVCPSSPAQLFHILRSQVDQNRPLIVFMPKFLLRYPPSLSALADFTDHNFLPVIGEAHPEKTILCTGKVYYDLIEKQKELGNTDRNIVRIEQLYPLPIKELESLESKEFIWVQEEPENMGAWEYIRGSLPQKDRLCYVGRNRSASTAAGYPALHNEEKNRFLTEAFEK